MSATVAPQPSFRGRLIVEATWRGKSVQVVDGMLAYKRKAGSKRGSRLADEVEKGFSVTTFGNEDRLGIGMFVSDRAIDLEQAASIPDSLPNDIQWVEPVMLELGSIAPNDSYYPQQWGLREVRAEEAWSLAPGPREPSITVAVLDTGIALENGALCHRDLQDGSRFLLGDDVVNNSAVPSDDHGHGTHVSGIAAATKNNGEGIAGFWDGRVYVVKVFDHANQGTSLTFKDGVLKALDFAAASGGQIVINYSGGGPDSNTKRETVEEAARAGALIVAAVGNDFGGAIQYPAAYSRQFDNVVAVGAVGKSRSRPIWANRGPEMDVVAPGEGIWSAYPGYLAATRQRNGSSSWRELNGTSQAAPLVAALGALVWAKWPAMKASEVRRKILDSADVIPGSPEDFGRGIINAEKTLT